MVTDNPLDLRIAPIEAAVMPLPREETTPPVRKMYFVVLFFLDMNRLSIRLPAKKCSGVITDHRF